MSWQKVSLESISTKIGDGLHGTPKYDDSGEFYFINGNNLSDGKILIKEDTKRISSIEYDKIKKELNDKTVLVAINGTIGNIGLYRDELVALGKSACYINTNEKAEKLFVRYVLANQDFQIYARDFATGSTIKNLGLKAIRDYNFNLPPLPTQRKIASILSAYDDLIENNLKRIKLLEEKAFASYKLIVKSEKLEKVKLSEVAVLNEESLKANSNLDKLLYVDIASVSTGSIDNKTEYELKEAPGRAKRVLKHKDIIWSCVRPNRKSYSFVWRPEDNLIASTGFVVITAKTIPATFLYQLVTANEFVNYLENHAKGATYPAVTASDFDEATIQIASNSVMKEYNEETNQCFEFKHILQKQNTKLREARDILLPKLMSGQIEV